MAPSSCGKQRGVCILAWRIPTDRGAWRVPLFATPRIVARQLLCPWGFSRQEYWMGCHALLQGIFLTQGCNPGLPHRRRVLYCLSYHGSPNKRVDITKENRVREELRHKFLKVSRGKKRKIERNCDKASELVVKGPMSSPLGNHKGLTLRNIQMNKGKVLRIVQNIISV